MPSGNIIYNLDSVPEHLQPRAMTYRDYLLQPKLQDLTCNNCGHEVIIEIKEAGNYFEPVIHKCCEDFEKKIKTRLGFKF